MVADHIFKLSSLPDTELLFESIFRVCHSILKGFSDCSIWRIYRAYFMKREKVVTTIDPNQQKRERDTGGSSEEARPFKKTRRGKRGGKHRPKQPKPFDKRSSNNTLSKEATSITVGDRLLSHSLRNGLLDLTLVQDGYDSQEDMGPKRNIKLMSTPPKKKRRRSVSSNEKSSGNISHSSTNDSISVVIPQMGYHGLKFSLDMRTMTTEVRFTLMITILIV